MADTFSVPEEVDARLSPISHQFRSLAEGYVGDLIDAGLDANRAVSVMANIMLREAWVIAGAGKIHAGLGEPDVEKFVECARAQAATVTWRVPEAASDA